jgi:hypothetical protein
MVCDYYNEIKMAFRYIYPSLFGLVMLFPEAGDSPGKEAKHYFALSMTCREILLLISQNKFASSNCKCTPCDSCFCG